MDEVNPVSDEAVKQLLMLKELTKQTGVLHEAQVLQLRMWSMLAMTHSNLYPEIHFSHDLKELEFQFKKLKKKDAPKDLEVRLDNLVKWCHWLLGDEYLVRIKDDKGIIRRGMRGKPIEVDTHKGKNKVKHEPKLFDGDPE